LVPKFGTNLKEYSQHDLFLPDRRALVGGLPREEPRGARSLISGLSFGGQSNRE
jgi:hypothetical protein